MTLPPSLRDWPADALEAWREREAIMWADGVPRSEVAAEIRVRLEWGRRDKARKMA